MKAIIITLILALALPVTAKDVNMGTVDAYHNFGSTGFMEMHKLFEEYSGPVITLPTEGLTIKIFNDHKQLPFEVCRIKKCGGLYHPRTNTIWIYARYYQAKQKIVVRPDILGHELMHWLQYQNKYMFDPDVFYNKNVGGIKIDEKTGVRN